MNRLPRLWPYPRSRIDEFWHPSVRPSVRGALAIRVSDVPSTQDCLRFTFDRKPKLPGAKTDSFHHPTETLPNGSSDSGKTDSLDVRNLTREDQCPTDTGDHTGCFHLASSGMREGTLCHHEEEDSEGNEPELANSEPPSQPPDVGRDCSSNLEEDCYPAYPPASEDGAEQREDGSVPPQAQESRTILLRMPNEESENEYRRRRRPSDTAIAPVGIVSRPHGRCRRRRQTSLAYHVSRHVRGADAIYID